MSKRWTILLEVLLMIALCAWLGYTMVDHSPKPQGWVREEKIQLPGPRDRAWLVKRDGVYSYVITSSRGEKQHIPFEKWPEFEERMTQDRPWWAGLLNVNTKFGIVWVAIGLLGQVLFTGRMIIQWIASEKEQKSVVPPMFWWMSLGAATMLLMYFLWRRDPVGVLGQAFGWVIYIKNLWFIYKPQPAQLATESPSAAVAKAS